MKKLFLTGIFILGMNIMMNAQTMKFPATVMFTSECCGVPTDSSILKMIQHFKKQYHIKTISWYHIGPLGREGEYNMAFPLTELKAAQKRIFIKKMQKLTLAPSGPGHLTLSTDYILEKSTLSGRSKIEKHTL
ncbi:MAG: hypothetical protein IPL97_10030 [Niastella sp.]|nr:hypothetical protein [Niastella sp.]